LNGGKIGDAVLTPCRTEFRTRINYDVYDVTGLLKLGENAAGIILGSGWFNGLKRYWGWQHQWYGSPRALLQVEIEYFDGTRTRVMTDGSWCASWGPITFNCIFDGEDYDARLEMPGWDTAGFDDSSWLPANVVPSPGGKLVAASCPPNKLLQTIPPVRKWETSPGTFIFDMGVNFTGWVRLRVKGERGATVQMRYSE
jgi:alpha-L-rhamnosidase